MKLSVVIPTYNNQATIEETLKSIVNQTFTDFEIIIVNDGSSDRTLAIINSFSESYTNIIVVNQNNQGPSKSRNNGAKIALGDYLVFIDADDKVEATYFQKAIKILDENPKLQLVYSDVEFFGVKNGKWKLPKFELVSFLGSNCIPIFAVLRTSVFKNLNGFDENIDFTEDWELWIRIVSNYDSCVYKIEEPLYFYRKSAQKTSLTDLQHVDMINDRALFYIYKKHYNLYQKHNLGIIKLFRSKNYEHKYYNIWYKKIFYFFKKPKQKKASIT